MQITNARAKELAVRRSLLAPKRASVWINLASVWKANHPLTRCANDVIVDRICMTEILKSQFRTRMKNVASYNREASGLLT